MPFASSNNKKRFGVLEDFILREEFLHWTPSAVDCYERKCRCNGCILAEILETPCKMKYTVIQIIKVKGLPPKELKNININRVIDLLEAGKKLKEIAEILDVDYVRLIRFVQGSGISGYRYKGGDLCRGRNNRN